MSSKQDNGEAKKERVKRSCSLQETSYSNTCLNHTTLYGFENGRPPRKRENKCAFSRIWIILHRRLDIAVLAPNLNPWADWKKASASPVLLKLCRRNTRNVNACTVNLVSALFVAQWEKVSNRHFPSMTVPFATTKEGRRNSSRHLSSAHEERYSPGKSKYLLLFVISKVLAEAERDPGKFVLREISLHEKGSMHCLCCHNYRVAGTFWGLLHLSADLRMQRSQGKLGGENFLVPTKRRF